MGVIYLCTSISSNSVVGSAPPPLATDPLLASLRSVCTTEEGSMACGTDTQHIHSHIHIHGAAESFGQKRRCRVQVQGQGIASVSLTRVSLLYINYHYIHILYIYTDHIIPIEVYMYVYDITRPSTAHYLHILIFPQIHLRISERIGIA